MAAFDEKDYTKSFDWSIWKRLTPFVRPFRRDFVGMLVFNGLCALVDVAIPLFQRYAIRNFIQADSLRGVVPFSLAYLLVIVLQALSVVAFARNSMTIEMNMGRDMRRSLFHHLQTLSFSFYNVTPVGYLLTRVMSDTNRIASMIAWNMTDILWALFYVLGTFAAMLALNWRLALVVIVIVPVMAVLTGYFQNRILRWNRKVRKLNSRITGSFNEGITGAKTTKTLGTEEQTVAAFRDLTRQMHDAGIGAARLNAIYIPLVLFASTMAVAIVLLRGGYMVSDHLLELATLSTFTTYAVGIFEPIQMTLINFFCIGAPGFVLGLEPNNARVKGAFLTNVLKRALPASIAVILAAALDIFVARVFGFSQLTLSTMCLLTSCAASVSLIWRISQPLTPLRVVLFVFVVAGILVGVIGFPELLSIANLSMGQMVILAVIVVFTCSVFFKLATMMDSLKPRRRHAATGFGRGVRVHLGRGGGKVSSTGSTAERFAKRVAADMAQRREDRTAREAEARALEGVAQAQPKKKRSTGAKRSRVTKSAQGIKVSMPSKKKK